MLSESMLGIEKYKNILYILLYLSIPKVLSESILKGNFPGLGPRELWRELWRELSANWARTVANCVKLQRECHWQI